MNLDEAIEFLQKKLSGNSSKKSSKKTKSQSAVHTWMRIGLVVFILFVLYSAWSTCRKSKGNTNSLNASNGTTQATGAAPTLLNNINKFLSGKGSASNNSRNAPTSRILPGCTNCKTSRNREELSTQATFLQNAQLQTERGDLYTVTKPSVSDCNALLVLPRDPLSDSNVNKVRAMPKRKLKPIEKKERRLRRTK